MADPETCGDSASPDFTRLPSGERGWADFIDSVAAMGDVDERHFIELKSDIDPTDKDSAAKVAKFILGAANRDPERAKRYLEGRAVMLLGIGGSVAPGLERFEAKDFVGAVQPYVGEPGPHWDFQRIPADDDRDVIVVIVDPPQAGDPAWPCCREGPGLIDGRIYIRADGETREAKSGDVRALQARALARGPRPDLAMALQGSVNRFQLDPSVLRDYIAEHRQRLEKSAPTIDAPASSKVSGHLAESIRRMMEFATAPDDRSRDEYLAEIDEWEREIRQVWRRFTSNFAFSAATPTRLEVCSQSYLGEVKVQIHLNGPVRALDDEQRFDLSQFESLPNPRSPWGPRSVLPTATIDPADYLGYDYLANMRTTSAAPLYSPYDNIEIDNADSADMAVLVKELLPQDRSVSSDELTFWVGPDDAEPVTGTWRATAKGHHESTQVSCRSRLAKSSTLRNLCAHTCDYNKATRRQVSLVLSREIRRFYPRTSATATQSTPRCGC
jgi:hypothetical protein